MSGAEKKKLEQVLQLDPSVELVFHGPFKDVVTTTLKLGNPTEKMVAFKVKTTAPRHYCVKPNSGLVKPNDSVNVDVMLQPFDHDAAEHKRHKFMVQTMFVGDEAEDVEDLWKASDQSAMMDSKLKCVFEMPKDNQENDDTDPGSPQRQRDTGSQSPQTSPDTLSTPAAKAPSPTLTSGLDAESARKTSGHTVGGGSAYSDTSQEVPLASSHGQSSRQKQIEEQLETLKAENLKLKKDIANLKEEGPRQRLVKDVANKSPVAGMNMSQELSVSQISPILAAILALIVGYLIGKLIL